MRSETVHYHNEHGDRRSVGTITMYLYQNISIIRLNDAIEPCGFLAFNTDSSRRSPPSGELRKPKVPCATNIPPFLERHRWF